MAETSLGTYVILESINRLVIDYCKGSNLNIHLHCMGVPMTNDTSLGVFRTHAQKEYGNILEMKSTPILNILALLLF